MRIVIITLVSTLALAACDGPKEKAGVAQDKADAVAAGMIYNGNGPNERLGEEQDQADHAATKARNAQVDALKKQSREVRSAADVQADKLEEQAKSIRSGAKDQAKSLDAEASNVQ